MWKWAVLGVLVSSLALADDESDRNDLIRNIDDKVKSIAYELDGFTGKSDVGDLDDALSYARELRDLVSRLDNVKGSDSRANDIVSRYPGYIDSFREAAKYLKLMKQVQRLADGVADRCTSDENDLQTLIRNYVGNPDTADDAASKLPEKGRQYGTQWSERLDKLKDADRDMSSNASYARLSISDNYWSNVSDKVNDGNSGMQRYWSDHYGPVARACERLALGERHPDIVKALETLAAYTGNTKGTVTQLKKDYNAWLRGVRQLREFSEKDREELREVMCRTGGEYDMEQKVKEVADRWAGNISSVYGTTLGMADGLRNRATDSKLARYKGPREVLDGLKANVENLEKLKNYELQGANNPKIKTKLEYGKQKHAELQGGSLCSSGHTEVAISSSYCSNAIRPGSGCRADCVVPSSSECVVIEIKPRTDQAMREGTDQMNAYADGLRKWYADNKAKLFEAYPKLQACESGDRFQVGTKLEPYDFCPTTAELTNEPMRDVPGDLSESPE